MHIIEKVSSHLTIAVFYEILSLIFILHIFHITHFISNNRKTTMNRVLK